jgi:hypothetical protein
MTNFSIQILNANELAAVEMLSANLKKGASVQVVSYKETKMNKGNKTNRNPYLGRVFERTTIGGWVVGTNYSRSCQNAAERSGSEETFEAKSSWHVYFNDFFETDKATHTKFYLQLQKSAQTGCKTEKVFYLDGQPATAHEVESISKWIPSKNHNQSSSQVEAGVKEENERNYILLTLDTIESITQGGFTYKIAKVEKLSEAYAK